jgi:dTDP-4-amino-4,6-dideoxygalactose transaminase
MTLSEPDGGVPRETLVRALTAEGVPGVFGGYVNVHLLPMYQQRIAYGRGGFPWTAPFCDAPPSYRKGICPVAEALHDRQSLNLELCSQAFTDDEIDQVAEAFRKVWRRRQALAEFRG